MVFSDKLKMLRKQSKMSQEQLAEKLNVSRQAVTKWEIGNGMPDIDNILTIASLFNISLDELLTDEKRAIPQSDFITESLTRYDIEDEKHYDIDLGSAADVLIGSTDSEKLHLKLCSNTILDLDESFKIEIEDNKKRINVKISNSKNATQAAAKQALFITVLIPRKYFLGVDIKVCTDTLKLNSLKAGDFEIEGGLKEIYLDEVKGRIQLNSSDDMNIVCGSLDGRIVISQVSASSQINIPMGTSYLAKIAGTSNRIMYTNDNKASESKSDKSSENIICISGISSELIINEYTNKNKY